MATTIKLPHEWEPRPYQLPVWEYMVNGGKRAVWIAHRRAGKDDLALHLTAVQAMRRPGNYYHMLPLATQARRAIWNAINPHSGKRRIHEAFHRSIIKRELENEMVLELVNGSFWSVCGSDNYENTLIGSPPCGLVFSEWALSDESCWGFLSPILVENNGWSLFVSTPRGRNHCYTFYEKAKRDPEWFAQISPATETGVFTPERLAAERAELIELYGEEQGNGLYKQEYLCSWESPISGSVYGLEMEKAEAEGRITSVPVDPRIPVHTSWDLGIGDATAIIMAQVIGQEIHIVDYIENSGMGLDWYVHELQKRNYVWGQHWLPQDAAARELGTGRSRIETLRSLGINARLVPMQSVQDGLNAVRTILPKCWFEKVKAKRLVECLQRYRRAWDDLRKVFSDRPIHDQFSHGADAMRYLALSNLRNPSSKPINYSNRGIV